MKKVKYWLLLPVGLMLLFAANGLALALHHWAWIPAMAICFALCNLLPTMATPLDEGTRLRMLIHGYLLLSLFLVCTVLSVIFQIVLAFFLIPNHPWIYVFSVLLCIGVLAFSFWNGIISVYCTSIHLGLKMRIIGAICGTIPLANLIALYHILKVVRKEIKIEENKWRVNWERRDQKICKTKYPIVLVHGFFFRDSHRFNYWGRVPDFLMQNGAALYYGNHPSAASVAECAQILTDRIQDICIRTGSEKVNVIAHSKGGLDIRYAMTFCGAAPYIASLTTVSTPHRGCKYADWLLGKVPPFFQRIISGSYNSTLKRMGEEETDFMAAVWDLTCSRCQERDAIMPMPEGVYCQSIGSKINRAARGKFPWSAIARFVKIFDGPNDGLVGKESFSWGPNYTFLENDFRDGISHADTMDLHRRDVPGFDVREFYAQLVSDLRQRGL